jgi:FAD/FMN-containing dehydrogenase
MITNACAEKILCVESATQPCMHMHMHMQAVKRQLEPFVFEWTRAAGGSISAEHGIGTHKKKIIHYSQPAAALSLMRKMKAVLDPKSTLNPGKIVDA